MARTTFIAGFSALLAGAAGWFLSPWFAQIDQVEVDADVRLHYRYLQDEHSKFSNYRVAADRLATTADAMRAERCGDVDPYSRQEALSCYADTLEVLILYREASTQAKKSDETASALIDFQEDMIRGLTDLN